MGPRRWIALAIIAIATVALSIVLLYTFMEREAAPGSTQTSAPSAPAAPAQ